MCVGVHVRVRVLARANHALPCPAMPCPACTGLPWPALPCLPCLPCPRCTSACACPAMPCLHLIKRKQGMARTFLVPRFLQHVHCTHTHTQSACAHFFLVRETPEKQISAREKKLSETEKQIGYKCICNGYTCICKGYTCICNALWVREAPENKNTSPTKKNQPEIKYISLKQKNTRLQMHL